MSSKVILIGPPGAGKSTVGRVLAKRLNLDFIDTDKKIEERAGKTIGEIFTEDGEAHFRAVEREIVIDALNSETGVVALGGGSVLDAEVQNLLREEPFVIFLEVSISNAGPRVGFNRERPLLMVNPRQRWIQLMEERRPIYEGLARFTFSTDNRKAEEVVNEMLSSSFSKAYL